MRLFVLNAMNSALWLMVLAIKISKVSLSPWRLPALLLLLDVLQTVRSARIRTLVLSAPCHLRLIQWMVSAPSAPSIVTNATTKILVMYVCQGISRMATEFVLRALPIAKAANRTAAVSSVVHRTAWIVRVETLAINVPPALH